MCGVLVRAALLLPTLLHLPPPACPCRPGLSMLGPTPTAWAPSRPRPPGPAGPCPHLWARLGRPRRRTTTPPPFGRAFEEWTRCTCLLPCLACAVQNGLSFHLLALVFLHTFADKKTNPFVFVFSYGSWFEMFHLRFCPYKDARAPIIQFACALLNILLELHCKASDGQRTERERGERLCVLPVLKEPQARRALAHSSQTSLPTRPACGTCLHPHSPRIQLLCPSLSTPDRAPPYFVRQCAA